MELSHMKLSWGILSAVVAQDLPEIIKFNWFIHVNTQNNPCSYLEVRRHWICRYDIVQHGRILSRTSKKLTWSQLVRIRNNRIHTCKCSCGKSGKQEFWNIHLAVRWVSARNKKLGLISWTKTYTVASSMNRMPTPKKTSVVSWVKETLKTNWTIGPEHVFKTRMTLICIAVQATFASMTVSVVLLFASTTYTAIPTVKNISMWFIIIKFADWTKIFRKCNTTTRTRFGYRANRLTKETPDLADLKAVDFMVFVFIVAKTARVKLALRTAGSANVTVAFVVTTLVLNINIWHRMQRFWFHQYFCGLGRRNDFNCRSHYFKWFTFFQLSYHECVRVGTNQSGKLL